MFALLLNDWLALSALGVLLLVGLGVAVYLLVGLFQARSLVWREFMAYFRSPIAYVVLVVFLLLNGYLFNQVLEQLTADGANGVEFPMQQMFGHQAFWWVFLFIPPLLTMRVFAEERGTGTLEVLMTSPLQEWQVVLSKFVACFAFYILLWLPTLAYLPVLCDLHQPEFHATFTPMSIMLLTGLGCLISAVILALVPAGSDVRLASLVLLLVGAVLASIGGLGHYRGFSLNLGFTTLDVQPAPEPLVLLTAGIDPWPVVSSYLGLALLGAMLLALGLLVSSLVRSQMVAALVSLVLSLVFMAGGFLTIDANTQDLWYRGLSFISVPLHFSKDFSRGVIDTRHLTLYASVAVFSLFLTVRSLETRRWR